MRRKSIFARKSVREGIFRCSHDESMAEYGYIGYIKLLIPILLFPILYFPYTLWWRRDFAQLAIHVTRNSTAQFVQLMLTGNNTILLFWCMVTAIVMLTSVVISVVRVRPWYLIPIYLAVMFSLCGIFSLMFYTAILR